LCGEHIHPLDFLVIVDQKWPEVSMTKSCVQGDSGGPLTVANPTSGAHTLVGAVSWGAKCATEGQYGVLADVPFFRTWIDETIAAKGGATFCS